jgi:DNA-binding Xre family transcriptional regulator
VHFRHAVRRVGVVFWKTVRGRKCPNESATDVQHRRHVGEAKMSVTELAGKVGITMANISVLKSGKAKAIRFSTLEAAPATLN